MAPVMGILTSFHILTFSSLPTLLFRCEPSQNAWWVLWEAVPRRILSYRNYAWESTRRWSRAVFLWSTQKAEDMPVPQIKDFCENEQRWLSAELKSPLAVMEWLFNQYYYRAQASLTHSRGKHSRALCFRKHLRSTFSLKKANWGTVHGQREAQRPESPPLQSVSPAQWLPPSPPPPAPTLDMCWIHSVVLNMFFPYSSLLATFI